MILNITLLLSLLISIFGDFNHDLSFIIGHMVAIFPLKYCAIFIVMVCKEYFVY